MKKNFITTLGVIVIAGLSMAAGQSEKPPTATELLAAMDKNLKSDSRTSTNTMIVNDGRREREYKMIAFAKGEDDSAIEYLEPRREKGTRMLKKADELWLYMPRAERVQKISGHMMRQGMMGSDVSYEDMLASADFEDLYNATVQGSEVLDGRKHWKIEAVAKDDTVTYPKRQIWIDAEYLIPSKQKLFAKSGMLLKTWTMSDVKKIAGKYTPMLTVIKDELKEGTSTKLITDDVTFDVDLSDEVFSRRWLERG